MLTTSGSTAPSPQLTDTTGTAISETVRRSPFHFCRRAERYGVHVGNSNRGTLWKDADEAERVGFQLSIGG
ncbi:hypothetical protein [Amycolatopsis sp. NBRC 101858]|uniref:hypothetical protein n=1 Tax=Amycolatopsis sp. NBRC 101858 TaxID=3032200 RepID=UPI002554AACD|nr:hypothetical protein [Amycolatopsis sp. NBRC 101858]